MVRLMFDAIGRWIRRTWRWFVIKFFKRPLTNNELNANFLKSASKLTTKGAVEIYQGGFRAFNDALYDPDNAVYILVIKTHKYKNIRLRELFKHYGEKRKW